MTKPELTVQILIAEAKGFSLEESKHDEPSLFGITDGKAVGTYLEQKFRTFIFERYEFPMGNSASGIDFPGIAVDIKVTSIKQPQSSSPFKDAKQKIYGLGYHLLVFVYEKSDDEKRRTGKLDIKHTIFIDKSRTADYQMTTGILKILKNNGNVEDLIGFFDDKNLPGDDVTRTALANEVMKNPPAEGFLTISNALQWRLQYGRAIQKAGTVDGIVRVT